MLTDDYWQVIQLANRLEQFVGYLDTQGQKAKAEAKGHYLRAKDHLAYDLEKQFGGPDAAIAQINSDLAALAGAEPEWTEIIEIVRGDLIERIESQRRKNPLLKKIVRFGAPIGFATVVAVYLGTWFYYNVSIEAPLESKAGLIQRAEAYDKAILYEGLASGRGGLIKKFLLAPIEPNEEQLAAANDFAGLVLSAYYRLAAEQTACGLALSQEGQPLTESEKELISTISAQIRDEKTAWQNLAPQTVLVAVAKTRPCT